MRCRARKKHANTDEIHIKNNMSPFLSVGNMIMQRIISSLERLCSNTAPKYGTVSLASMSVPLIGEFKADLDLVHQQAVDELMDMTEATELRLD